MFIITIMNSIYFTDIYNEGSENLSNSQSQQLIVFNIVTCLLLFIAIILIIYMLIIPSDNNIKSNQLAIIVDKKQIEFEEKSDEFKKIEEDVKKKKETRNEIKQIVSLIDASRKLVTKENKNLNKKITNLSTELNDLNKNYGNLYDEHGNLIKTNEQLENELKRNKDLINEIDKNIKLKEELEEARKNKTSIIMEGASEINEKNNKESTISFKDLFQEDSSLNEILDEVQRSLIITDDHKEKNYDYGLNVKPENFTSIPRYNSFNYNKNTNLSVPESQQRTFFIPKESIKLSTDKPIEALKYTPYYPSFLNQMFSK